MKHKILAAKKIAIIIISASGVITMPAIAGIPTIDVANITQTTINALENVAQTQKQIAQYQSQLQQYELQLKNSLVPSQYIWDNAQTTIDNLMESVSMLDYYKNQAGSVNAYLEQFGDIDTYTANSCFTSSGCTNSQLAEIQETKNINSTARKEANDAYLNGLTSQQQSIESDANQLESLQSAAQGADGQMAAIQFANQIASQQSNQLLQIRSLLVAQGQAVQAQQQSETTENAIQEAASEQLRSGSFVESPSKSW